MESFLTFALILVAYFGLQYYVLPFPVRTRPWYCDCSLNHPLVAICTGGCVPPP